MPRLLHHISVRYPQVVLRPRFLGIAVVCRRLLRRLVELRVIQVGVEATLGE